MVSYKVRDVVESGGNAYVCILAHNSSAATRPGVGVDWTTYWNLMVKGGITINIYVTINT